MVCKEDVLLWFKDLESYKRIDVLYELLNMCLPFELRFLGSCVEEIGRHSYQELRGSAINANDFDKLSKDVFFNKGLLDENVRHRVLIYLSLLSSRNYSVANWLYKTLLRTDWIEDYIVKGNVKDDNLQSEFLLLFLMALHHPAFTFDQKLFFGKILTSLIEIRENKNRISPKPPNVYGYPPGFGYPTIKTMNVPDGATIPVKSSITMSYGDDTYHQQTATLPSAPPPPPSSQPHIQTDFMSWNRPGYPYGAPEVPPFPATNISPLVSQSASPIHSRNSSPHRPLVAARSAQIPQTATAQPPQSLEIMQINPQMPAIDPLSPNLAVYNTEIKIPDEEVNNDDKAQMAWIAPGILTKELKPHNGLRFPSYTNKMQRPYIEQFQALSLDGDNSLHQSNSSSNSSLNPTPPDTPIAATNTTVVTNQHCPGRGDKTLVNGMPSFVAPNGPNPGLPLCDTTSPPPPQPPTYNNCSVPYTTYPASFTAIPTRSMFPYTQSYRPPFTAHFASYQTNENSFPTYTLPYMSIMYSSPQYPQRSPNCYNCGAGNHIGQECTRQNIEDITQKKTYNLEFAAPLPDADK